MLEALEKTLGIVTTACNQVGINRKTHYQWLKLDPAYKEAVDEIRNVAGDFVESSLMKCIKEGKEASIIFYCKTKLRNRGYIEKQEMSHTLETNIPVSHWAPKKVELTEGDGSKA